MRSVAEYGERGNRMQFNSDVVDSRLRLAMKNQSNIEGKRVSKDEIIVIALRDLMVKQEKVMNNRYANLCK